MPAFQSNRRPSSSSSSSRRSQGPAGQLWNSLTGGGNQNGPNSNRQRQRQHHKRGAPVGTQAKAMENIQHNQRHFKYPKGGFVTQMEHSLLYNMVSEPNVYPEDVVLKHIDEEDFASYLLVATTTKSSASSLSLSLSSSSQQELPERISYAQLSALLALSAENFPPKGVPISSSEPSLQQDGSTSSSNHLEDDSQPSIPKKLCKSVLQCVVRYAEEHNLDRKQEIQELLEPVQKYTANRTGNAIFPLYAAYMAGILIPGGLGLGITMVSLGAIIASSDQVDKEAANVNTMRSESYRVADIEKAGLLDEAEEF